MAHIESSPLILLLVEVCVVLLASRLTSVGMMALGQPSVVAEILVGILLGPSVLGWLWPDALQALFPSGSLLPLRLFSQLGLVLFMFLVGLELDATVFRGRARAVVFISHASIAVPFGLGAAVAWWLWPRYSGPGVPLAPFMLFIGVAMSVTAFPVLARILSERGLLGSRIGTLAIACAAIDDITAWCLLAIVIAVARAGGTAHGLRTTALAVVFVITMLCAMRPLLRRIARSIRGGDELTPGVMAVTFVLIIACSIVTELIGIHALFGAFILGAVAPKQGDVVKSLAAKLETITVVLLLPLFFAYSGLRTQIGLLDQFEHWLVAAGLVVIATLGKFGGSAVAARMTGLGWREASALGVLMNTRGLMELVVLNAGMDLGILSPAIFTMLVIMALLTTCATTPMLRRLWPGERSRDCGSLTVGEGTTSASGLPAADLQVDASGTVPARNAS